jgi:hypothetical protein
METREVKETIALPDIQEAGGYYYRVLDVGGFSAFSDQSANSGRGLQRPCVTMYNTLSNDCRLLKSNKRRNDMDMDNWPIRSIYKFKKPPVSQCTGILPHLQHCVTSES